MMLSFTLGGVGGIAVMAIAGGGRKTRVPFGPFLVLGTISAIFFGRYIIEAYVGTL